PGRAALLRDPLASTTCPAHAGARGIARAHSIRDAVPAGREPRPGAGLVQPLPGAGLAASASAAARPRRKVAFASRQDRFSAPRRTASAHHAGPLQRTTHDRLRTYRPAELTPRA